MLKGRTDRHKGTCTFFLPYSGEEETVSADAFQNLAIKGRSCRVAQLRSWVLKRVIKTGQEMLERDEMLVGRDRRTRTGGSKESRARSQGWEGVGTQRPRLKKPRRRSLS